jgi:hypothetical protein
MIKVDDDDDDVFVVLAGPSSVLQQLIHLQQ